jgi:hypothetical protein
MFPVPERLSHMREVTQSVKSKATSGLEARGFRAFFFGATQLDTSRLTKNARLRPGQVYLDSWEHRQRDQCELRLPRGKIARILPVGPNGADHQSEQDPTHVVSGDMVPTEGLGPATGRAEASGESHIGEGEQPGRP